VNSSARAHFVTCYIRILNRVWQDVDFAAALTADPRAALAECGLQVGRDDNISVIRSALVEPDVRLQLALWEDGEFTGNYVLHAPVPAARELSDIELDGLAGGAAACRCRWCLPGAHRRLT